MPWIQAYTDSSSTYQNDSDTVLDMRVYVCTSAGNVEAGKEIGLEWLNSHMMMSPTAWIGPQAPEMLYSPPSIE
jgi:hypothetical protein